MDLSLWSSGSQVAGTAVQTALMYLVAIVGARMAGRRTLAQMSGFDIVVTVAIGTLVASAALPSDPAVSDGAAALATFLGLQVAIAAVRQRFPAAQRWIDFRPEVVVWEGEAQLPRAPWTAQLTRSDVESRLREHGIDGLRSGMVVVLEPGGRLSLIENGPPGTVDHDPHG